MKEASISLLLLDNGVYCVGQAHCLCTSQVRGVGEVEVVGGQIRELGLGGWPGVEGGTGGQR